MQIVHLTLGLLATNCFIVADSETDLAAVIDPADEATRILAALTECRKQLTHILLTHAHFDHFGAAADLAAATGAPLALHPLDEPLLHELGLARAWGLNIRPAPQPALALNGGQVIEIGNTRLQVLHVPGHSPGHVAFYAPAARALFSGDVLFRGSIGRTDLPGGDYGTLLQSIRQTLYTLPDDVTVYPGHGAFTGIGIEKRTNPFVEP